MKHLTICILLFPLGLLAQIDRIRTEMPEAEFVKEFPEAKRDLDAEAVWVSEAATVNEVSGNALWRIYNDSIASYRFSSKKEEGPSKNYPKFDSTAVHKLREVAMIWKNALEKEFGKPETFRAIPFTEIGGSLEGINPAAVWAMWNFGNNDYIVLSLTTDLSTGNFINAPGKYTVSESASYELSLEVKHRSAYTKSNYGIGMDDDAFFKLHPDCAAQVKTKRDHIYTIADTTTSENAAWEFAFSGDTMLYFTYKAYLGTGYGSKSDDEAYHKAGAKADALLKQRNENRGNATEKSYNKPVKYKPHDPHLSYNENYVHAVWVTPRGNIVLDFNEFGGGKSPEPVFYVQVHFEWKQ